jgi:predicted nucleotidyltransferase
VRLFGSRAKGTAREDSDVDLAVTTPGTAGEMPLGIFVGEKGDWERALSTVTGLRIRFALYDPQTSPETICYCRHASVLLYERSAGPAA